jgi:long-chain fatty acid transport protein
MMRTFGETRPTLRRPKLSLAATALGVMMALLAPARSASAAGLYQADRGVRPLSRAGAFVAGADDLGAMVYNPAGLYDAGTQVMLDAGFLIYSSDFTRQAIIYQTDPNSGAVVGSYKQTFPTASGKGAGALPIPTIGASFQLHKQLVVAVGAYAPYTAITTWPDTVNNQPAPQRYSLLSLDGSALAVTGLWAAFAPNKQWRIGAGFEVLLGTFQSTIDLDGCVPDRFVCAPEQPGYDFLGQLKAGTIVAPSGNVGAIYAPHPNWRIGASFQLPYWIHSPATITTRMPSSPFFERATQVGHDAEVSFDLPWQLRFGVETRVVPNLRVEAGFAYDRWSMHDAITIQPKNIAIQNIALFPASYAIPTITLPRNFRDAWSVRLGGEYGFGKIWGLRGGVSYESSAVPANSMTVLTVDGPKATLGFGAYVRLQKLRVDFLAAHVFILPTDVDPATAQMTPQNPVIANPPAHSDIVNGGHYTSSATVLGLGLAYTFETPPPAFVNAPSAEEPAAKSVPTSPPPAPAR